MTWLRGYDALSLVEEQSDKSNLVESGTSKALRDFAGRHIVRLNNDAARRPGLVDRSRTGGSCVQSSNQDWKSGGHFSTEPTALEGAKAVSRDELYA